MLIYAQRFCFCRLLPYIIYYHQTGGNSDIVKLWKEKYSSFFILMFLLYTFQARPSSSSQRTLPSMIHQLMVGKINIFPKLSYVFTYILEHFPTQLFFTHVSRPCNFMISQDLVRLFLEYTVQIYQYFSRSRVLFWFYLNNISRFREFYQI